MCKKNCLGADLRRLGSSRPSWARMAGLAPLLVSAGLLVGGAAEAAGIQVPAGTTNTFSFNLNLDCGDLQVEGTLNITNGASLQRVAKVTIGAAGVLNLSGGARIGVSEAWSNSGAFNAGDSSVLIDSSCGSAPVAFSGDSRFHNLSATIAGQTLQFAPGSEQTVGGALELQGVTLLSSGSAYLTLEAGGSQAIGEVSVDGVDATRGQHLAPSLNNLLPDGVAPNWFRSGQGGGGMPGNATPVPVNGPWSLAGMGLALALGAWVQQRRRRTRQADHASH